jgi:hypothetical protein
MAAKRKKIAITKKEPTLAGGHFPSHLVMLSLMPFVRCTYPVTAESRQRIADISRRRARLGRVMSGDLAFNLCHARECLIPAHLQFAATSRLAGSVASYCRKARSAA